MIWYKYEKVIIIKSDYWLLMQLDSILPHQNLKSLMFIGGPLDNKYFKVAHDIDCYIHKVEESDEEAAGEYVYRKKEYPWRDNRTLSLMIMDGVPESYISHLSKSIKEGMVEDVPLPVILMCLPRVEQFDITKD